MLATDMMKKKVFYKPGVARILKRYARTSPKSILVLVFFIAFGLIIPIQESAAHRLQLPDVDVDEGNEDVWEEQNQPPPTEPGKQADDIPQLEDKAPDEDATDELPQQEPFPTDKTPSEPAEPDEQPEVIIEMEAEPGEEPEREKASFMLETVDVIGERSLSAASDSTVRNKDFMNYPRKTASDLLRFIPGLHITQHTGGAKAHQIFLRGFDAEHGQDVAAYLDGIPLNETSHVHGAGYLDLHFLIPESIRKITVMNGPYDPRYGNFATAGVIDFIPYTDPGYTYAVAVGGGSDWFAEALGGIHQTWYEMDTYMVAEFDRTEGYTNPGEAWASRGFLNHRLKVGSWGELRLLYAGYGARSKAADILPKQWIDEKRLSRFDSLDGSNRVDVDRHLTGLTLDWKSGEWNGRIQGYYNYKNTRIWSNYSFYYFNPERGDQLEQSDKRHYAGLNAFARWFVKKGGMDFSTEAGLQLRSDWVDQTQANTEKRQRFNVMNHYDFNETVLGVYIDERMKLARWVRIILGARLDSIFYNGDGTQDRYGEFDIVRNITPFYNDDPASLDTYAYAVSPKASIIFRPLEPWNIFLNFGRGITSTYARQLAWEKDTTIPVVTTAEIGNRIKLWNNRLTLALSGWWAEKEAETVFDSEFGTTIPRGKSRRLGADFEFRIAPTEWMYIGTDVYYVHARFVESGKPIPNMAEWMMTNLIAVNHISGFRGSIRGRFVGPRKHDLGYDSDAYYIVDAQIGWEIKPVTITLSVENLFNTIWYDSVYAYPSRPEQNGEEVEGLHVTPGTPTVARLRVEVEF